MAETKQIKPGDTSKTTDIKKKLELVEPENDSISEQSVSQVISQKEVNQNIKRKIITLLERIVTNHFERLFVLIILCSTVFINYFVVQKLAFLNFYYLPIIAASYFLGLRTATIGATLCVLMVIFNYIISPGSFITHSSTESIYIQISTWGGFLILAAYIVGKQQEKIFSKITNEKSLNEDLIKSQNELKTANQQLKDYTENLEVKVNERTAELEKSHASIQELKNKVEDTLYATMDSAVVQQIITGRLRSEKREIGILFTDLVNFTSYCETLSPDLVVRDLNRFLATMEPIISSYQGHIDKFIGDSIMCEFGAPIPFAQYKLLCVLSALKMQEKLRSENFPWKMRIGIACGPSIVGMFGSKRKTYTAMGDVVNLASRLEGICPAGGVLIDHETYIGIERYLDVKIFQQMGVEGKEKVKDLQQELEDILQELKMANDDQERAILNYKCGHLHLSLCAFQEAYDCFKTATLLGPNTMEYKMAFAEATLKLEEQKIITIKGKVNNVQVLEVIGLKDPLKDGSRVSRTFFEKYRAFEELLILDNDHLLPIEAIDGSIGHSRLVALFSYAVAKELNLCSGEVKNIVNAGYLADIGKGIIPENICNRVGHLNSREFSEVMRHPDESIRTLKRLGIVEDDILNIIKQSHEYLDGSGYPQGLSGSSITREARIVTVCDSYAALISWRPYRDAWSQPVACDELLKSANDGKLDPKIVNTLISIL